METSSSLPELSLFFDFEKKFISGAGIKPMRTEWRIVGPDEGLGGTIDFVGLKPDGTYILIDWKSTKGMSEKMTNAFDKKAL